MLENNETIRVKCIPRLEPAVDAAVRDQNVGGAKRKTTWLRPPQKLFNPKEVGRSEKSLSYSKGYWIMGSNVFDKDGFLEKEVRLNIVETEGVVPTLEEITKFFSNNDDHVSRLHSTLTQLQQPSTYNQLIFHAGDSVIVKQGALMNAQGTVVSVNKEVVTVKMKEISLGDVEMESKYLSKSYAIGDHVRVVQGHYKDESGMITQINDQVVTIFSDLMVQFDVFVRDVQMMAEVSTTIATAISYSLFDLIYLG